MSRPCDENGLQLDEDDYKSQSNDHDMSSIPGHTEPDCDDSSEVFDDSLQNDTSGRCPHCDNAGGHSGHPSTKCPECGRWSAPPLDHKVVSIDQDTQSHMPPVFNTIAFDLTDPEGERRLREMLDAPKMKLVLWELDQWLRGFTKYGCENTSLDGLTVPEALSSVRQKIYGLCDDHGIRLDED